MEGEGATRGSTRGEAKKALWALVEARLARAWACMATLMGVQWAAHVRHTPLTRASSAKWKKARLAGGNADERTGVEAQAGIIASGAGGGGQASAVTAWDSTIAGSRVRGGAGSKEGRKDGMMIGGIGSGSGMAAVGAGSEWGRGTRPATAFRTAMVAAVTAAGVPLMMTARWTALVVRGDKRMAARVLERRRWMVAPRRPSTTPAAAAGTGIVTRVMEDMAVGTAWAVGAARVVDGEETSERRLETDEKRRASHWLVAASCDTRARTSWMPSAGVDMGVLSNWSRLGEGRRRAGSAAAA